VRAVIDYTNWRGERRQRRIKPVRFYFGEVSWHPGPQWLVDAIDLDRTGDDRLRTFALSGIHGWRTV
jgi:predicted DNA-binding transcriptional regulator YafY